MYRDILRLLLKTAGSENAWAQFSWIIDDRIPLESRFDLRQSLRKKTPVSTSQVKIIGNTIRCQTTLARILHPSKMLCGMLAVTVAFGLFYYITNSKRAAIKFKRDHPILSILIILTGGYFIVHVLGSVVVFLFGILLPIVLVFIHASMRLRNIKNKLTNKIETIGLKKTPMGLFLDALGQEQEAGSEELLPPPRPFTGDKPPPSERDREPRTWVCIGRFAQRPKKLPRLRVPCFAKRALFRVRLLQPRRWKLHEVFGEPSPVSVLSFVVSVATLRTLASARKARWKAPSVPQARSSDEPASLRPSLLPVDFIIRASSANSRYANAAHLVVKKVNKRFAPPCQSYLLLFAPP
ncbi:hypothetical protein HPB51_002510 [Rhipicephalus microplus]|uniref:PRA1 family protein n=1 Tax=Rhipicephalus microplus TaxID=6941 RepID=A0A9J6DF44_RHIMP|nr:hypothetical protein HPB51_002510 [Rhipicephalus microplus]